MGLADLSGITFPWDTLAELEATARAHPGGMIDLSMGTPVDPTPPLVREALAAAADAPGYPTTAGTPQLRAAVAEWFARRRRVPGLELDQVLPTVGSKELVGLLPSLLGVGPGDVVVHPEIAYPTYAVGAAAAGATALATDDVDAWAGRDDVRLVWVNSPANPHGRVLDVAELRRVVAAAREIGAVVVSDECYAELGWGPWAPAGGSGDRGGVPSILDPRVCDNSHVGLLAAYSLSKQSNLAGYRAAFVAGDGELVGQLLARRRHLGLIVPAPVQAAMVAALGDDEHVAAQRRIYGARRRALAGALERAGLVVDHSEAGLYLWVRAGAERFAERGVLVAPGGLYGRAGEDHVRTALTATDAQVADVVSRLTNS
ncbi:succinyldiaminopimelate transaminase [Myceligenerans pegani]|uniref:Aminotransferase n=1 Tax=Myceligenerans pegani TaxID=2776917 RepID=A0ABR9MX09_9MICO|nr:succinyldiaminopimelate transaminase [Myceligenerans sp. TRM 65318]MBE1875913.1 succinyldiaminopimelate transaminase [Myceligenerans sp. TRM 65318]MBE3018184.1 succinyldiaminopimelate transaminase [Myceligenerans sp. TRM 65318]